MSNTANLKRCDWVSDDPLYLDYHDQEWGVPLRDDRALFELLILEGAQAGLAWITVLRKRESYRRAFDGFQPEVIAKYGPDKIESLLQDPGIIRNRAKVSATVKNAQGWLDIMAREGSFAEYVWGFVEGEPIVNRWTKLGEVPAQTTESKALSKALKARGFSFVGPTICYAFMQAAGLVNDHTLDCFRHDQI